MKQFTLHRITPTIKLTFATFLSIVLSHVSMAQLYSSGNNSISGNMVGIGVNTPTATLHLNDLSGPGMALPGQSAPTIGVPLIRLQSFDPSIGLLTNYWDFRMDLGSSLRFFQANSSGVASEKLQLGATYVKVFDRLKVNTGIELSPAITPDGTNGHVLSLGLTELGTSGAWQGSGAAIFSNASGELFFMNNSSGTLADTSDMLNHVKFKAGSSGISVTGSIRVNTDDDRGFALAINGEAICNKLFIKTYSNWPDFVFDSEYSLMSLKQTEQFIRLNHHLPGVPTAKEVREQGFEVGQINAILLQKIEELTLQLIELDKQIKLLQDGSKK